MDCSIVIPHYERHDSLETTLAALGRQITSRQFEIIVVDDGSTRRPAESLKIPCMPSNVRFIDQDRKGISSSRNTGWKIARGNVIVFLDCDQIALPDFVDQTCKAFAHYDGDFVQIGERSYLPPESQWSDGGPRLENARPDERTALFRVLSFNMATIALRWHFCFGHNIALRRATLLRVGGFDESFAGWGLEDCEFAFRLVSAGTKVVFNPAVQVFHQYHTEEFDSRYTKWLKNLRYFEEKHPSVEVKLQYALQSFFDPEIQGSWIKCVLAMERAARVLNGHDVCIREKYVLNNPSIKEIKEFLSLHPGFEMLVNIPRHEVTKIVDIQTDPVMQDVLMYLY